MSFSLTNFGQKEYFVVIFLLPYFLTRLIGADRVTRTMRILIGIAAGVAICLKPHQVLAVFLFEIIVLWHKRELRSLLRSEMLALVVTCASYPLAIEIFCPLFFKNVLPMMLDAYWGIATHTMSAMLVHQESHHIAASLLAVAVWLGVKKSLRAPILPLALIAASIGSGLAYALQRTGWAYQQLPAWTFLILAIAWMLVDLASVWASKRQIEIKPLPAVYISTGLLFAVLLGLQAARITKRKEAKLLAQATISQELAMHSPGTPVYLISTSMPPFQVLLTHHLLWAGRYAHLWMLPAIEMNEAHAHITNRPFKLIPPAELAALSNQVHQDISSDISSWNPEIVFVEHVSPQSPTGFNHLQWLLQDNSFALKWAHYKMVKTVANYDGAPDAYDEYVRAEN
ncbi:hypothetical protein [Silvibacterium dinghuense]|uniref:Glycosyltransferase RgtA/B/C/D-like domain-containing protein n=1 Tax=Silvibacterium dinghuense TaxID=1560006 RepID=A0A4Q1SDI0_9BACT|nr:hypothetical protein [Silvibacterium dinghuense]RXS95282.1 hypothetical protein ESZ00_11870 [Silvibacterium dinghuense]